jgi:hypothetical protein
MPRFFPLTEEELPLKASSCFLEDGFESAVGGFPCVISQAPKNPSRADNAESSSSCRTPLMAFSSKSSLDYAHINASTRNVHNNPAATTD